MPETEHAESRVVRAKPHRKSTPKSTALTTTYKRFDLSRRYLPAPAGADLRRWFLYEGQGMSVNDIAAREGGAKPEVVQASIDYIKEYQFRNQIGILNAKTVQVAMERLDDTNVAIEGALKAKKVVHVDRETGKVTQVEDHAMRLKAAAENRALIETMQPRTPGVMVNQQFNSSMAVNGYGGGGGMSFESVLRRKRELKGMVNEQVETVEAELSHEEQVAKEFEDFGGDEEEDEEDENEEPDESST